MAKNPKGFVVEVYWGEIGTPGEGRMEDCRYHLIEKPPTKKQMSEIEKGLKNLLVGMGLYREEKS